VPTNASDSSFVSSLDPAREEFLMGADWFKANSFLEFETVTTKGVE
jgi:hypothetical protein